MDKFSVLFLLRRETFSSLFLWKLSPPPKVPCSRFSRAQSGKAPETSWRKLPLDICFANFNGQASRKEIKSSEQGTGKAWLAVFTSSSRHQPMLPSRSNTESPPRNIERCKPNPKNKRCRGSTSTALRIDYTYPQRNLCPETSNQYYTSKFCTVFACV